MNIVPAVFQQLLAHENISESEILHTRDGFWVICRSLAEILARSNILDIPNVDGTRFACDKFFDDWFLYAVPNGNDHVYSLLKLREQEHDAEGDLPADGDTPGVTISFIPFSCEALQNCLAQPADENRRRLDDEIDRVVVRRGQRHHEALKTYFTNSETEGAYLVADLYVKHVASFAENGTLNAPDHYKEIARNQNSRVRRFVESINQAAECVVCDHEKIYIQSAEQLTEHEYAVILSTHTGNPSRYSFAAEVEYHARFLISVARIRLPLFRKSVYDAAARADMTIGDAERRGFAPFYRENSRIVKKHRKLHRGFKIIKLERRNC